MSAMHSGRTNLAAVSAVMPAATSVLPAPAHNACSTTTSCTRPRKLRRQASRSRSTILSAHGTLLAAVLTAANVPVSARSTFLCTLSTGNLQRTSTKSTVRTLPEATWKQSRRCSLSRKAMQNRALYMTAQKKKEATNNAFSSNRKNRCIV